MPLKSASIDLSSVVLSRADDEGSLEVSVMIDL